jgi:integrase
MNYPKVCAFFRERYRPDHPDLQSPRSIEDYETQIGHFGRWWEAERPGEPTIADLNRESIASAMAWLSAQNRSPYTVNKLRRVLRALERHACEVFELPQQKRVKPYKCPFRKPSAWTEEQMGQMLWTAGQLIGNVGQVPVSAFMRALILSQYNTGSRISALMAVRWESIDLTSGLLVLQAETTKDREEQRISLKPETVAALAAIRVGTTGGPFDHWPYDRSPTGKRRPWKSLTNLLKKIIYVALVDTEADVNRVTVKQVKQVIGPRDCTHKIRRTFATEIAARQGIKTAQELLGHASEVTTAAYVDVSRLPRHSARDILPTLVERPPTMRIFAG